MTAPFTDLTLPEAEERIVGACLRHRFILEHCLLRLPYMPFRSLHADDLHRVFYTVAGWYARGSFDEDNEERLVHVLAPGMDTLEAEAWLDAMWCPWSASIDYVDALLDALLRWYALRDAYDAATEALITTSPLAPSGYDFEFADWEALKREFVERRRARAVGANRSTPESPPPPVAYDWEGIRLRREKR